MGLCIVTSRACTVEVRDGRKFLVKDFVRLFVCICRAFIQQDFYVVDLGGVDMIIRMDWLAQLGKIHANVFELTLQIPTKEGCHILRGDLH